jgi:hypothetical protein
MIVILIVVGAPTLWQQEMKKEKDEAQMPSKAYDAR